MQCSMKCTLYSVHCAGAGADAGAGSGSGVMRSVMCAVWSGENIILTFS